eukprot:scpid24971/ scgid32453/ Putative helicase mov-10-B.1
MEKKLEAAKHLLVHLYENDRLPDDRITREQLRIELSSFKQKHGCPGGLSAGTAMYVLKTFRLARVVNGDLLVVLAKGIKLSKGELLGAAVPAATNVQQRSPSTKKKRRAAKRKRKKRAAALAAEDTTKGPDSKSKSASKALAKEVLVHSAVKVSSDHDIVDGIITVGDVRVDLQERPTVPIICSNESEEILTLQSWKLKVGPDINNVYDRKQCAGKELAPGDELQVQVCCNGNHTLLGTRNDICEFVFSVPATENQIVVRYLLSVRYVDEVTCLPANQPKGRFSRRKNLVISHNEQTLIGDESIMPAKPEQDGLDITKCPLKQYREDSVKSVLRSYFEGFADHQWWIWQYTVASMDGGEVLPICLDTLLMKELSPDNYKQRHLVLLLLEHRQEDADIHKYDLPAATMKRVGTYLSLKVPGLAENRPSLLRGDFLVADLKWKGYVHRVERDGVLLKFHSRFQDPFINGKTCKITFSINPTLWWLKNRAICTAMTSLVEDGVCSMLFPDTACLPHQGCRKTLNKFYNSKVERNDQQRHAVESIVSRTSGKAPYLVFGPPGTGKTTTIVEAILQVASASRSKCRVLVCTPSNSAADLITARVMESTLIPAEYILRLNAHSRNWASLLNDDVKAVSQYDRANGCFFFPSLEEICRKRLVVCTLTTSGRLVSAGMSRDHFTHIFIDECGHAVEAECLIPLSGMVRLGSTQVVLAGDPKQLGPVVRSRYAQKEKDTRGTLLPEGIEAAVETERHNKKHGLEVSFLERLMTVCDLYQRKEDKTYNSDVLTKLVNNYRSHPDILKIPNELFYDSELIPCADELVRERLCKWTSLPPKTSIRGGSGPIIFHGVLGKDEREASNPSFFNDKEYRLVKKYVDQLREIRGLAHLSDSDIGVISPYHNQVTKIRSLLKKDHETIKVGTVEEFQGQERMVIIISAVRSQQKYADIDETYGLGFLNNEKRFNVAVTRAKALLIVIGNPYILETDRSTCWTRFLKMCIDNRWYVTSKDDECIYPVKSTQETYGPGDEPGDDDDLGLTFDHRQDPGIDRGELT